MENVSDKLHQSCLEFGFSRKGKIGPSRIFRHKEYELELADVQTGRWDNQLVVTLRKNGANVFKSIYPTDCDIDGDVSALWTEERIVSDVCSRMERAGFVSSPRRLSPFWNWLGWSRR